MIPNVLSGRSLVTSCSDGGLGIRRHSHGRSEVVACERVRCSERRGRCINVITSLDSKGRHGQGCMPHSFASAHNVAAFVHLQARPVPAIYTETSRAYWRVVIPWHRSNRHPRRVQRRGLIAAWTGPIAVSANGAPAFARCALMRMPGINIMNGTRCGAHWPWP